MLNRWLINRLSGTGVGLMVGVAFSVVALVEAIVIGMDWLLLRQVTWDYLLTGLVASGVATPICLAIVQQVQAAFWRVRADHSAQEIHLANDRLRQAQQGGQMVFWELDVATGRLILDPAVLPLIGLPAVESQPSLNGWIERIHPEDQSAFVSSMELTLRGAQPSVYAQYRLPGLQDEWIWVHTRAEVTRRDVDGRALWCAGGTININARIRAEQALADQHSLLNTLLDALPLPVFFKDTQGCCIGQNAAFAKFFGCSREEMLDRDGFACSPRELTTLFRDKDQALLERPGQQIYEAQVRDSNGALHDVMFHKATFGTAHRKVAGLVGIMVDETERKAYEAKLELAAQVIAHADEAVIVLDLQHRFVEVNPAFTQLTGYAADAVLGRDAAMLRPDAVDAAPYDAMRAELHAQGHWQGELLLRRSDNQVRTVWHSFCLIRDKAGRPQVLMGLLNDITERKRSEALIWKQANFDSITGLPNRHLWRDRLEQAIKQAARTHDRLALLYVDLDHFKEVNDTFGHEVGDRLLGEAARRMAERLRATDTAARLGGDEFSLILTAIDEPATVQRVGTALLAALAQPYEMEGHKVLISASIGVAFYPQDASDADQLCRRADRAMYSAKALGRNCLRFFTPTSQS